MKKNVVPHKFKCQNNRKRATSPPEARPVFLKRQRLTLLEDAEKAAALALPVIPTEMPVLAEEQFEEQVETSKSGFTSLDVGVQTNIKPHYRSKALQTTPSTTDTASSPFKIQTTDASISPLMQPIKKCKIVDFKVTSSSGSSFTESEEVYNPVAISENDSLSSSFKIEILKSASVPQQ
ncbi:hypothetical protein QE152_g23602 [Popillia japonica]|uniref:Uncharacterized protein n=1 Tax=Popillia japonica TaxID=7064 RepID=A0AAW1KH24_POPJA